ncbi:MAG TPA: CehA/McbA family metallohydrolase [Bryobacteraceae bacterium]|nr:CehA/McbA family metallohydrolase [Bryobacteraceae bacterium]
MRTPVPFVLSAIAAAALCAQVRDSALHPDYAAHLEVIVERGDTGEAVPARIYLFREGRQQRLSPVDNLLPLLQDNFYRNRIWRMPGRPKTLEVTIRDMSHVILLEGRASFDVPAGKEYRLEAYHGLFYTPASADFALRPEEHKTVTLKVYPMAPGRQAKWISADDHVHLTRAAEDDEVFLRWMQAEDLNVVNDLEGQRQQHFGMQYAWGPRGEGHRPGFSIRSGHETRSDFYGHVLVLGGRELIRPLGIGEMYGNSPEAYPYPAVTFAQGRKVGGLAGFAHFHGSREHSTLIMDLALHHLDFVEVMQYALIKMQPWYKALGWYELLNAGFRVVGTAGCDFPDPTDHFIPWPRALPLLGPERTLVKAEPGASAWETWADGIRRGAAVVTNGPLLEFAVHGREPGAVIAWTGASHRVDGVATATFHRPIEKLEIVCNGKVVASRKGDGRQTELSLPFQFSIQESSWVAARAQSPNLRPDLAIWAHSNPVYLLRDGKPVYVPADRELVRLQWEKEAEFYRGAGLVFAEDSQRKEFFRMVEETREILRAPQPIWPARAAKGRE